MKSDLTLIMTINIRFRENQLYKQTGRTLLALAIIGIGLSGCSVRPVSVVPASTSSTQEQVVQESAPVKEPSYEPSARSNTAYPSSAARQLITQAEGQVSAGDGYAALRSLERAQRISPRAPEIYLEMAEVRQYLGQLSQAKQLANKAMSLVGNDDHLKQRAESFLSGL